MSLDANKFKEILISGSNGIINNKQNIDLLNVFPVPDGDTGSNMASTAAEAADEIKKLPATASIKKIAATFSRGMLFGARGNSGVILSQILRGFSTALNNQNKKKVTNIDIVNCFNQASELAYKSVIKPIEGTILTVVREVAENLSKKVTVSMKIDEVLKLALDFAKKSLDNTPNLLPILKEVGVVDSGGEGLYQFINGMYQASIGKPIALDETQTTKLPDEFLMSEEDYNGEQGYCTEFIVNLAKPKTFSQEKVTENLEKHGSSLVVVTDEDILKVHIHALKPGSVMSYIQRYGEFRKIKIDNMSIQANNTRNAKEEHNASTKENDDKEQKKNLVLISVGTGQGLIDKMKELGADFIIEGGQTMNPSAADFLKSINEANSDNILLLPNNSNIILSAQQAARTSKKNVSVIPSKSLMQGMGAIINFNPDGTIEENQVEMSDAIAGIKTIQVTTSLKTTKIHGVKVKKDEYLTILDKKILGSSPSKIAAVKLALKKAIDEDSEVVSIYYGADASEADANELAFYIENNYDVEVEVNPGGQPVYNFLVSVE